MILTVLIFMYCFLSEKILTFHVCFFSSIFQDRQLLQP